MNQTHEAANSTSTVERTWHPTDFGFFESSDRSDVYKNGKYELRRLPQDMWLLRRIKGKGSDSQALIKLYYMILHTDYEFANWLFNKRLNKF